MVEKAAQPWQFETHYSNLGDPGKQQYGSTCAYCGARLEGSPTWTGVGQWAIWHVENECPAHPLRELEEILHDQQAAMGRLAEDRARIFGRLEEAHNALGCASKMLQRTIERMETEDVAAIPFEAILARVAKRCRDAVTVDKPGQTVDNITEAR